MVGRGWAGEPYTEVVIEAGRSGADAPEVPPGPGGTRQRILDAAAKVLSRNGYAGTRLSDVAGAADLQSPAIYRYFSSREDLIEEVMTVGHKRFLEHVPSVLDALPPETTALDRVLAAVAAHIEVVLALSDYATASTRNMSQLPENMRAGQHELRREYGAIWRELLADAQRAGQLCPDVDLRAAQGLIIGALSWSTEWWEPERRNLQSLIKNAQDLVRFGIGR